jgi:hypothetical protein
MLQLMAVVCYELLAGQTEQMGNKVRRLICGSEWKAMKGEWKNVFEFCEFVSAVSLATRRLHK